MRRRWLKRLLLYGTAFLLLAATLSYAILRGPSQGRMLYWQRQAMAYRDPESKVVYRFSPASLVKGLLKLGPLLEDHDTPGSHAPAAGTEDACELLPDHIIPLDGAGDPAPLAELNRYLKFILTDNMQVLFCHSLRSPAGEERLVIVEFGDDLNRPTREGAFEILTLEPAGLFSMPKVLGRQRVPAKDLIGTDTTTFFAGQPSAQDPTTFTLPIEQAGARKMLVGKLETSGRRIALSND